MRTVASSQNKGMILTKGKWKVGEETFPDEKNVFTSEWDLEEYINCLDESHEAFDKRRFKYDDPELEPQNSRLKCITKEQHSELYRLFKSSEIEGIKSESFSTFRHMLYELGIIFNFKWTRWHEGNEILNNPNSDFSKLSILELSMLLTTIIRSDRFNDTSIQMNFDDGTIKKLITHFSAGRK